MKITAIETTPVRVPAPAGLRSGHPHRPRPRRHLRVRHRPGPHRRRADRPRRARERVRPPRSSALSRRGREARPRFSSGATRSQSRARCAPWRPGFPTASSRSRGWRWRCGTSPARRTGCRCTRAARRQDARPDRAELLGPARRTGADGGVRGSRARARASAPIKVKTGQGVERDVEAVRRVRDAVGSARRVRVDANMAMGSAEGGDSLRRAHRWSSSPSSWSSRCPRTPCTRWPRSAARCRCRSWPTSRSARPAMRWRSSATRPPTSSTST